MCCIALCWTVMGCILWIYTHQVIKLLCPQHLYIWQGMKTAGTTLNLFEMRFWLCQQCNVICVLLADLHPLVAQISACARTHTFDFGLHRSSQCYADIWQSKLTAKSAICRGIKHETMENQLAYLHRVFLLTKVHHWKTDVSSNCFGSLA